MLNSIPDWEKRRQSLQCQLYGLPSSNYCIAIVGLIRLFVFPTPPKYSYRNVHELVGKNKKGSASIRKIFSRNVNVNWEKKAENLREQTGDNSFSILDVKRIFSIIGKSSLDPLTREKILRLIQRKYMFNANWEHCNKKPDPYYGPGCTLCRING